MRALALLMMMWVPARATVIELDTATTLLDGSTFTAGTSYLAAFQFTGNGITTNTAAISSPLFGAFTLDVDPVNSYALVTQLFVAGSSFAFEVELTSNLPPFGFPPDQFSFQLYDAGVTTLLYEVALDVTPEPVVVPEPAAWSLVAGAAGVGALVQKVRRNGRKP